MTKKKKHKYQQLSNYDIDEEALAAAGEKQGKNEEEDEEQNDNADWDDDEKTIKHQNSMNSSIRHQEEDSKKSPSSASSMMSPSTDSLSQQQVRKDKNSSPKESPRSSASAASDSTSRSGSKSHSGSGRSSSSGGCTDTSKKKRERIKEHMKKMFLSNPDKDTVPRPKVTPLEGGPTGAATAAARKIHRRRSSPVNVAIRNGANADNDDVNSSLVKHWKKAEEKVILANMAPVLEASNKEQILIVQQQDNQPALVQLVQPINTNATTFADGNNNTLHKHRQDVLMKKHRTNPFDVHRRKDVTIAPTMATYPSRTTTVASATSTSHRKRTPVVSNTAGLIPIEEQNAATAARFLDQRKGRPKRRVLP